MISALLGLGSAFGLGAADFMARFSARALGATLNYAAVLLIGALAATVWLFAAGTELVWSPLGYTLAVAHGIAVAVMCVLLYMGIARGPIAVVVPIVAAHPALVLLVNVLMGVRPSAAQWAAMATIIAGATIWLVLTDPVTVANALDEGEISPLVRQLAEVIYKALSGLLEYL